MTTPPTAGQTLDGLVPDALRPAMLRIFLADFDPQVDIGRHDAEAGVARRPLISVEMWVDDHAFARAGDADAACHHDVLRAGIRQITEGRRFALLETLVREIYALIAARAGVRALRVSAHEPHLYADCADAGVEIASFRDQAGA